MRKNYPKHVLFKLGILLLLIFAGLIIHSCKKDTKNTSSSDALVARAKAWYESAYPLASRGNGQLIVYGTAGSRDLSQWIKPDWQHNAGYHRLGKAVIEMPIDPEAKFSSALK